MKNKSIDPTFKIVPHFPITYYYTLISNLTNLNVVFAFAENLHFCEHFVIQLATEFLYPG